MLIMCFLHHFVIAKLATICIRVNFKPKTPLILIQHNNIAEWYTGSVYLQLWVKSDKELHGWSLVLATANRNQLACLMRIMWLVGDSQVSGSQGFVIVCDRAPGHHWVNRLPPPPPLLPETTRQYLQLSHSAKDYRRSIPGMATFWGWQHSILGMAIFWGWQHSIPGMAIFWGWRHSIPGMATFWGWQNMYPRDGHILRMATLFVQQELLNKKLYKKKDWFQQN